MCLFNDENSRRLNRKVLMLYVYYTCEHIHNVAQDTMVIFRLLLFVWCSLFVFWSVKEGTHGCDHLVAILVVANAKPRLVQ